MRQWRIQLSQRFFERAGSHHLARLQHHQMVGELRHFFRRMRDVKDRHRQFVVQAGEEGQDFLFALEVECRQRFIHQQHLRADCQGAGNGYALLFTAGKFVRHPFQQMRNAEQFHRLFQRHAGCG